MFETFLKKRRVTFLCEKDEHKWEYYIRGNATVDNLDNTYGLYSIQARRCPDCGAREMLLKNGWEEKDQITIHDLE